MYNLIDCIINESETIEKPWGWVFFYQSKDYIDTENFRYMLVGNEPIIVNRFTGELYETSTAYDIDYYLEKYEANLEQKNNQLRLIAAVSAKNVK